MTFIKTPKLEAALGKMSWWWNEKGQTGPKIIGEKDENTEILNNLSCFAAEQCSKELILYSNYEAIIHSKENSPTKLTHFDVNRIGKDADK